MFKDVIRVVDDKNTEIGHVAEDARDSEARWTAAIKGCCRADSGEAAQVKRTIRLQFYDLFCAHGLLDTRARKLPGHPRSAGG